MPFQLDNFCEDPNSVKTLTNSCFQFLAIKNKAALYVPVCFYVVIGFSILLVKCSWVRLLVFMANACMIYILKFFIDIINSV